MEAAGHATQPPARYTEASLVAELETRGIGRPSTYASVIQTIQDRGYVWKKGSALVPSWTAFAVVRLLERFVLRMAGLLAIAGLAFYAAGAWGCTRLTVENKFIDYFKSDSEVYKGLEYIDQHMGGTTPPVAGDPAVEGRIKPNEAEL